MDEKRTQFSLVGLIIVIVLGAPLLGVLTMNLRHAQTGYDQVQTLNNLKQVALACHDIHGAYRRLPPAFDGFQTVHYHLVPFVGYESVAADAVVSPFLSPDDNSANDPGGVQNFAANLRVFSDKGVGTSYNADIDFGDPSKPDSWDSGAGRSRIPSTFEPRGTSSTIMLATRYANNTSRLPVAPPNCSAHAGRPYHANGAFFGAVAAQAKAHPITEAKPTYQLAPRTDAVDCFYSAYAHSFHDGGLSVALADASIRTISPKMSPELWNRAMQPNTDLPLGDDWPDLSQQMRRQTPPGIRE